ncbi:MAG: chaperonin GroEL [Aphanocapsa feldmannii 277cI]|uniref:Chaperonin GroEL n=1 Tax=Aphanocapsa feldmannii 277cI TaxID=2507554 RepID=A0A524RVE3_9CHRO|nr:MAG: chaperonin GroEL [Aphanocapsa feldmannii 277cI]
MAKQLRFHDVSLGALEKGVDTLADAVRVTLGPKGRNVVLGKSFGAPDVINDGNSVAKEIELEDAFENIGVKLIQQVAARTKEEAGDGTTTATLLAQALIQGGIRNVTAGASPVGLKRGLDLAVKKATDILAARSTAIEADGIRQIATVSAGGDDSVGDIIAAAVDKVSIDGAITIALEVTEGMEFDRGYCSPYFVTNQETQVCELEDALILVTDRKISGVMELVPILEAVSKTGKPLLILADDIEGEALSTLVINKSRGVLNVAAVKAPSFGDRRKQMLQDIAVMTGATLISEDVSLKLDQATLADLGQLRRATITKSSTTLLAAAGHEDAVRGRIANIRHELDNTDSGYDREKLEERIAKLSGGVAVIKIGAATETELKSRKLRMKDALSATRAAVEEGVVAGGGSTLVAVSTELDDLRDNLHGDERTGVKILQKALTVPLQAIASNAGFVGDVVVDAVQRTGQGFNATTGAYEDLLAAGVIDPVKVLRLAIADAASIAGLLITTEVIVADIPEPAPATPAGGGGAPGMAGGMPGMPGMGGGMPGMMPGMM